MQLRPHLADRGTFLSITHGTKGGRDRVEPIRTPQQRALLERAKAFCSTRSSTARVIRSESCVSGRITTTRLYGLAASRAGMESLPTGCDTNMPTSVIAI